MLSDEELNVHMEQYILGITERWSLACIYTSEAAKGNLSLNLWGRSLAMRPCT